MPVDLDKALFGSGGGALSGLTPGYSIDRALFGTPNPAAAAKAKKPKKKGWTDVAGSLASDLMDVPAGLVTGAYALARHPIREGENMVTSAVDMWEPFVSAAGQAAEFDWDAAVRDLERGKTLFVEHPLGYLLFLGAGVGGAAGRVMAVKALPKGASGGDLFTAAVKGEHVGPRETINVSLGGDYEIPTRVLPKSAARAWRMKQTDKALKRLVPADTQTPGLKMISEFARFSRAAEKKDKQKWLKAIASPEAYEYQRAFAKLNKNERAALQWHNRFAGDMSDLAAHKADLRLRGTPEAKQTLKILESPKFLDLYENLEQHPDLVKAMDAAEALMALRTEVGIDVGALGRDEAAESPYRYIQMTRGQKVLTKSPVHKHLRKIDARLSRAEGEKPIVMKEARKAGKTQIARAVEAGSKIAMANQRNDLSARKMAEATVAREQDQLALRSVTEQLYAAGSGELNTNLLAALDIPLPQGAAIQGKLTTELLSAEFRKEIAGLREKKKNTADRAEQARLDVEMAKVEQDMADLQGDTLADPGWEGIRQQVYAKLEPMLEGLAERATRSFVNEYRREQIALRNLSLLERYEKTAKGLGPAREQRIMLLRAQRAKFNELLDAQRDLLNIRAQVEASRGKLGTPGDEWLRVYHGTPHTFGEFKTTGRGMPSEVRSHGTMGPGVYTTTHPSRAGEYAQDRKGILGEEAAPQVHMRRVKSSDLLDLSRATKDRAYLVEQKKKIEAVLEPWELRELRKNPDKWAWGEVDSVLKAYESLGVLYNRMGFNGTEVASKRLQAAGYTGIKFMDEIVVFDPKDLISRYGDPNVAQIKQEIAARGGRQPFYWPSVTAASAKKSRFASPGGSISPQRPRADIYNDQGILFRTGMLAMYPDVLTPSFLRMSKHDFYSALHNTAKEAATPIDPLEGLPRNYEWLKTKYGQSIPHFEIARGEHVRETADVFSDLDKDLELTSSDPNLSANQIVRDEKGYRLAVPKTFADQFRNEFGRSKVGLAKFAENALTVWRSLILHLRVPWLVNNIIGNALLTTLRFMGPNGLKAVLGLIAQTKGAQGVAKALNMDGVPKRMREMGLDENDMRELMPAQVRGTFLDVNMPTLRKNEATNFADKAGRAALGFLPKLDRRTEAAMRRISTNAVLRSSPEVKKLYKEMPKQTRSWRAAMRKGLEGDRDLQQFVNREVNDALGDFLALSRTERNVIRQAIPFYAWMREITRITAHTLLDHPGRAAVAVLLAQVGNDQAMEGVPSYLRGAIPVGEAQDGRQRVLNTRGMVPWTTVTDVGKGLSYFTPWGDKESARELLSSANPYAAAITRNLTETAQGRPPSSIGGFLDPFWRVTQALPQYQVVSPRESELYNDPGRLDALWRILGNPTSVINTGVAMQKQREEREG